ncbi:hypothetical protein F5X99DRAFT_407731 [Biscogniauxia marginata]|nr:hypothetical protein F5X99DRAFT_407731 [Biscogniauxia marginata]
MAASAEDPFTFIERPVHPGDDHGPLRLFDKYIITYANPGNIDLLAFAAVDFATASLNTESESVVRTRVGL